MIMSVDLKERVMAKKAGRPAKPSGAGRPVRVDSDVVSMARRNADFQGVPLSDYLSGILRARVMSDYHAMLKKTGEAK
jgi:hypothetical protein